MDHPFAINETQDALQLAERHLNEAFKLLTSCMPVDLAQAIAAQVIEDLARSRLSPTTLQ
jgi:hypothetical protein